MADRENLETSESHSIVRPGKLTWNPKITCLERNIIWTKTSWLSVQHVNFHGSHHSSPKFQKENTNSKKNLHLSMFNNVFLHKLSTFRGKTWNSQVMVPTHEPPKLRSKGAVSKASITKWVYRVNALCKLADFLGVGKVWRLGKWQWT